MTILSTVQKVCSVIGVARPEALVASTTREHIELTDLANEMAERIWEAHDWTLLRTLETITGDGSTTQFPLPSDYGRMLRDAKLWPSNYQTPLTHIMSTDDWLEIEVRDFDYVIGAWTTLGGNIEIKPAHANGETVKYYYISNLKVAPESGSNKATFTADDDTFRLNETTLKLGMIWQWKANKGQSYAEDMTNYEASLERDIARDKGAVKIAVGRPRMPRGVSLAYPQSITP